MNFADFQEATLLVAGDAFAWVGAFTLAAFIALALTIPALAFAKRWMNF